MEFDIWLAFFIASLLISISPGAGAVNTMSSGLQYGVRDSLPAIFGLQLGYGAQILLVGVGLGALLASSSLAFSVVKWLGVAYLVWLGYQKWTQPPISLEQADHNRESSQRRFWQAAFVNLTNPKATVFLLALFPQFINTAASSQALQFSIMGGTLILVDIGVMLGYASLAAQLSRWMKSQRHQILQNRIFGGMFIGAATLMASYRHSG
ncbi:MAG: homoserine/homoserine lactone efflux protein [Gammaproteobacteria bacterium]|nr:homoserine/homoserine lactone efflux protein [Gammaproteobacteria bacterium]